MTYARANGLVKQLIEVDVLDQVSDASYDRSFAAPELLEILLRNS